SPEAPRLSQAGLQASDWIGLRARLGRRGLALRQRVAQVVVGGRQEFLLLVGARQRAAAGGQRHF
ncbi:hypothetical protein CRUP_036708, partial [Coryphaenoides rupestris]